MLPTCVFMRTWVARANSPVLDYVSAYVGTNLHWSFLGHMDSSCLTPRTFVAQTFEAGCLTSRLLMSKTFNAKTFDYGDILSQDI